MLNESDVQDPIKIESTTERIECNNNDDEDDTEELNVKRKFHKKLIGLLLKFNLTFEKANVWMLNQVIIPLTQATAQNSNQLKLRYLTPENDYIVYNASATGTSLLDSSINGSTMLNDTSIHNVSIDENLSKMVKKSTISKLHIHTCYAFNQNGAFSLPVVVFPKGEFDSNATESLKKTTLIDETLSGDINEMIFFNWLRIFIQTCPRNDNSQPLILMCNSLIPVGTNEISKFCVENNVYLLFYPLDDQLEVFNKNVFLKFKDAWKIVLQQYSMKDNPNSQLSFLFVYKQVLRKILTTDSIKECFKEFLKIYRLPAKLYQDEEVTTTSTIDRQSSTTSDYYSCDLNFISDDCNPTAANGINNIENDNFDENIPNTALAVTSSTNVSSNYNNNIKFSEQETNEYCDWIKFMSQIGCLCVRYTFLRDLSLKYRLTLSKSSKEVIASEKKWLDLIKRNKQKFTDTNEASYCFNEDDYLAKWFDMDIWRFLYYKKLKEKQITNPSSIWTFDVIQFPCVVNNSNLLRAPERDLNRPRNIKPRISVLFAFNAAGDYIQPFIVYPLNFQISKSNDGVVNHDDDDIAANECYAQNGYINCKIFNHWLTNIFLPYITTQPNELASKKNFLLLYCGKLAVIDHTNMTICNENRVHLFNLTHDSIQPFNCLFQKSLRKRQTDLFLDSWRKITAKQNLSYQFKCKSKMEFRNLFMDTFQNCIEEIGDFKLKLMNTFEICQLWPVNEDEYKVYIMNGELALNKKQNHGDLTPSIVDNDTFEPNVEPSFIKTETILKQNSPAKIKKQPVVGLVSDGQNNRQKLKLELNLNESLNNNSKRSSKRSKNGLTKRKSKANSCSDGEYEEESDNQIYNNNNEDDDDNTHNGDDDDDLEDYEIDEEDEYYKNGYNNETSDDEFIPNGNKRRRISDSPVALTKQQKKKLAANNKKIQVVKSPKQPKQQHQLDLLKPQLAPIIHKQQPQTVQAPKVRSLMDLLKEDASLVASVKNIISAELIKYLDDKATKVDGNEVKSMNNLLTENLIEDLRYKENGMIEDETKKENSDACIKSKKSSDVHNLNESEEEEDFLVNNINLKILTNELLLKYELNDLSEVLNTSVNSLSNLYRRYLDDGLGFLKELCELSTKSKKASSPSSLLCNKNVYDLRFNFIKILMSNLYSNDFENDWSKFISIIDESLLL